MRGNIVPIIDLRERFGMESVEYTSITVVIVLSVKVADETRTMGIVSDTVADVVGNAIFSRIKYLAHSTTRRKIALP
ncbi:MAG: hypothetical protein GQ581_09020 [Methyloprofundus sp.]|nr:hypothetical protein [Methyloprofundus sp.]